MFRVPFTLALCGLALAAAAQTAPDPFPSDAVPIAGEALQARFAGRVFHVPRADGNHWRLQYLANGYYFVNTDRGFADNGSWQVEGDRICTERKTGPRACNPVRSRGNDLLLQRSNGEIITLQPK